MRNNAEDNLEQLTNMLKNIGKKIGKKAARNLFKLLLPFLPYIIVVLLIVCFILMLIAATYGSMPQAGTLTGVQWSSEDAKFEADYKKIAYEYNNDNTWDTTQDIIVDNETNGEPTTGKPFSSGESKSYKGKYTSLYPNSQVKVTLKNNPYLSPNSKNNPPDAYGGTLPTNGDQSDALGRDYPQALTWGMIHAMNLYYSYNYNTNLSEKEMKKLADLMRPYFFYKPSVIITEVTTKQGTSITYSYRWLLTEADTINGHYEYFYKWQTTTQSGDGWSETTTEEVPTDITDLHSQRFLKIVNQVFQTNYTADSTEFQVLAENIKQAGIAFTSGTQNMQWMLGSVDGTYIGAPVLVTDADITYQPIKNMDAVIAFLKKYDSALTQDDYLSELNQIGAEHNMNPLFLVAVMGAEQSFVPMSDPDWKEVMSNPFNVTNGSGPGSWQTYQPGFMTSAEIAAETLANDSLGCPSGWNVVEWIEGFEPDGSQRPITGTYPGRYAGDYQDWIANVTSFYSQLEGFGD